jgi:Lrp/AsnC family transcriptional regulator for asnA, asnC and gidA
VLPKLNELDSKILRSLLKDGRTSYDELAEECRVSKNATWKRCKAMEKKGVINGATVQINFGHFGFDALATLLISVNAQQIEQVMEFIGKITEVRAYRQYNSVYNVRATTTLRDLHELDHVKQVIKQKLPTIGLKTYIWTGVRNIPENLNLTGILKDTNEGNQRNLGKATLLPKHGTAIDELDKQIVEKLTLNGRASFTQISKQLGISTDTVVKRYYKLRDKGALKVSIQINPNKIGYTSILDFNIAFTTPGVLSHSVVESLAKIPDIIIITKTSGDYDLQVTAMIRDIAESFAIQDQIARISGVTKIEVSARKIPDKWPTPQQYISTF